MEEKYKKMQEEYESQMKKKIEGLEEKIKELGESKGGDVKCERKRKKNEKEGGEEAAKRRNGEEVARRSKRKGDGEKREKKAELKLQKEKSEKEKEKISSELRKRKSIAYDMFSITQMKNSKIEGRLREIGMKIVTLNLISKEMERGLIFYTSFFRQPDRKSHLKLRVKVYLILCGEHILKGA